MLGNIDSPWNKRIIEILRQQFRDVEDENEWGLPPRSNFYIEDVIKERIKRLCTAWRKSQCRLKEDGQLETEKEWEERMITSISEDMKNARHLTRRRNVSCEMWSAKPS